MTLFVSFCIDHGEMHAHNTYTHTYIHTFMYVCQEKEKKKGKKKCMHARDSLGMKEFKSITHAHTRKSSLSKKKTKKVHLVTWWVWVDERVMLQHIFIWFLSDFSISGKRKKKKSNKQADDESRSPPPPTFSVLTLHIILKCLSGDGKGGFGEPGGYII